MSKKHNKVRVLRPNEIEKVKSCAWLTVVFKKLNWARKNDLIGMSQAYNQEKMELETDLELYYANCIKELMVVIINDSDETETWIDESVIKSIDKDVLNGIMYYFFEHQHFAVMTEDEEWELRKRLHKYYRYWQLKESPNKNDRIIANSMGAPVCPSIIWKINLAERFGWTFETISAMDERDIREIQIAMSQEKVSAFEASNMATCSTPDQIIAYNKKLQEQDKIPVKAQPPQENQISEAKGMAHNYARKFKNMMQ
jgi:hypothetical protein